MRAYTQISSGSQRLQALTELKEKLSQLDVHVTPIPQYDASSLWQTYSAELQFYKSIAKSSFHILYNNDELEDKAVVQVLYAMYKKRPIIMIGRPLYNEDIHPELRAIFEAHIRQFHATNMLKLEFAELSFMLSKLRSRIDYRLTAEEEAIIITRIREYLYEMVGRGIGEMNSPLRK
jgi:hypothetical protein